jgi:signal transduction histidine kinase
VRLALAVQTLPASNWRADRRRQPGAAEVVREAVGNAIRHGRANRVWVTVSVTEQLVHLEVIDDGGGFEGCPRPGLGLRCATRCAWTGR